MSTPSMHPENDPTAGGRGESEPTPEGTPTADGADANGPATLERLAREIREGELDEPPVTALRAAYAIAPRGSEQPAKASLVDRVIEGARAIVASLVFDSRQSPAVAGWRSERASDEVQLAFEAEGLRIDVIARPEDEGTRWRLRGQLIAEAGEPTEVVVIARDGTSVLDASGALDGAPEEVIARGLPRDGAFLFHVPRGLFQLRVELDDGQSHVTTHLDLRRS